MGNGEIVVAAGRGKERGKGGGGPATMTRHLCRSSPVCSFPVFHVFPATFSLWRDEVIALQLPPPPPLPLLFSPLCLFLLFFFLLICRWLNFRFCLTVHWGKRVSHFPKWQWMLDCWCRRQRLPHEITPISSRDSGLALAWLWDSWPRQGLQGDYVIGEFLGGLGWLFSVRGFGKP